MHQPRSRTFAASLAAALFAALLTAGSLRAQDTSGAGQNPQPTGAGGPANTSPPDYNRTFQPREVTRKAVITAKPEPGFTEQARRNDTQGLVRLRAVLSKTGEVTRITVIRGLPDGLTEKAIAAARNVKFRPAQKDGHPVSQWVTFEYNFIVYIDDDDDADKKAVIHEMPQPEYTEEARRQKVAGKVVLHVMLYRDGTVSLFEVVGGLPGGLTEKAVAAAWKIKFTPAEDKGRKVSVRRRIEYVFTPD